MKTFFSKKKALLAAPLSSSRVYVFLSIFLLTITLLPLFLLCLYNHPSTFDDFVSFNSIKDGYDFTSIWRIGNRYSTPPVSLFWSFSMQPTMQEIQHMLIVYRLYSVFFILFFSFSVFFCSKAM